MKTCSLVILLRLESSLNIPVWKESVRIILVLIQFYIKMKLVSLVLVNVAEKTSDFQLMNWDVDGCLNFKCVE